MQLAADITEANFESNDAGVEEEEDDDHCEAHAGLVISLTV